MYSKEKKTGVIGWGSLFAAIIFLCNPDIGIFDIFPDFIGYLLLCKSISKVADIDDRIFEALGLFKKMIYISGAAFVLIFIQFGFIPVSDQSVTMLLFSFVYSVAELIVVIPAVVKLYEGILYLASRQNGENVYLLKRSIFKKKKQNKTNYGKTITEKFKRSTIVFVIIKSIFRTLPEFASLSAHGYDESLLGRMHLFIGPLRILGIMIVTIFAITWVVNTFAYVFKIKKDSVFVQKLNDKHNEEIFLNPDRPARKAVKTAFGVWGVAAVLSLDFYMDNINILPDILTAVCIVIGLLVIRKYIYEWKIPALVAVVYGVFAVIFNVVEFNFNANYYSEAIYRDPATYEAYFYLCIMTAIIFIACFAILGFTVMRKIIVNYTGFSMTTNDTYDPSEKIRFLHQYLIRKFYVPLIFVILSGAFSVISRVFVNEIGFGWLIEFVFTAIYAVLFIKLLNEINEQIDYKYMLS